ncbi:hypothetical protein [Pontibacter akesuensis]|uniref:Uncharacterized protein n=1 Tax=Pontibacter akesuensis TaxID=388950 RepID=A0A1I7IEH2_9BACT|nr:hypothetical protein [Pontibacter akesuensis]GHA66788.1 hypothetical protein GCM10007389_19830 [Pontibacter akesuensis]SFU71325.1 hypothetical protein SAMN04487941_2151 [Pontibacter akesuensis]
MQHEQHEQHDHDPRHRDHREQQRHRREHQQHHNRQQHRDDNFNDSGSRWGEPTTPLNLHQQNDWQPRDIGRFEREGKYHHEEWRPNEPQHRNQYRPHHHKQPLWRQRDVHFDPSNQRVEDRWAEDPTMPHPRQRPPRHYDGFWQDYED